MNGSTGKMRQKDNCTIVDELGNDLFLVNRRFVEGFNTPVMPLDWLITKVWNMKSG